MKTRLLVSLLLVCPAALAQHSGHGHDAPPPAETPAEPPVQAAPYAAPGTFDEAVKLLSERSALLATMAGGGLETTSDLAAGQAAAVRDVARGLVRLAMTTGSGFPPEKIRDLLVASRELAERADRAARAGSAGLMDETSQAISEVASSVAGIRRLAIAGAAGAPAASSAYTIEVISTPARIRPQEEAALQWIVRGPDGEQAERFELIDAEHMHLAVASRDASFVFVDAPQLRPNHRFTMALTLPAPGEYVFFHEFRPTGRAAEVAAAVVSVPGAPPEAKELAADLTPKATGGETASIVMPSEIFAGREAEIRVRVVDDAGGAAKLERVRRMEDRTGGFGRLTAVHAGASGAVFASAAEDAPSAARGELVFRATFPEAGMYRAEALFQHKLYKRTAEWVLEVRPAPAAAE